jgi:Zn-dependent protease
VVDGVRMFFRLFGPRKRRFTFRWMTLVTTLLILGKSLDAKQGMLAAFLYVMALLAHEVAHYIIAGRIFPGLDRQMVMAPLGGPASVPPQSSFKVIGAALVPAVVLGGMAAALMYSGVAKGNWTAFLQILLVISAANILPFFPLDGHVWLSGIIRKTHIYWRWPAWREYFSGIGGLAVSATGVIWDPLGMGVLLLPAGISMVFENAYMLKLRNRQAPTRSTGIPDEGRVDADEKHRMDTILEKIAREGMTVVTKEEEEFLQRMSERFRSRPGR